ncbi:MAG TPA: family 2 glycosyl transferase, partial [Caulobacter sp.]|nr:family 2 glycosyl transferase [Caulobacter sp.]
MAREERRLDPAFAPASGPVSVERTSRTAVAPPGERDGAHQTLSRGQAAFVALAGLSTAVGVALDPWSALTVIHHLFFGVFLLGGVTRLAAACTPLETIRPSPPLPDEELPTYTLIAPLYREAEVVAELVENLAALDYPRDRLQALIVLEADDEITRAAVRAITLPAFIQVLIAPPGAPKTKPRACNHALERAHGELVVI